MTTLTTSAKRNRRIATIRTAVPTTWGAGITMAARWFGLELSATDALIVAGAATVVIHRLGYVLQGAENKIIYRIGDLLLGYPSNAPDYDPSMSWDDGFVAGVEHYDSTPK